MDGYSRVLLVHRGLAGTNPMEKVLPGRTLETLGSESSATHDSALEMDCFRCRIVQRVSHSLSNVLVALADGVQTIRPAGQMSGMSGPSCAPQAETSQVEGEARHVPCGRMGELDQSKRRDTSRPDRHVVEQTWWRSLEDIRGDSRSNAEQHKRARAATHFGRSCTAGIRSRSNW